ncbi:MAG: phage major capsid protein [Clostridia bacterium]|nr:phage major capsid protein [Clostridia bacterium]
MSQILTKIEGILKDKYQPALTNLINIEPSPFLEMIRKEPLQNNKVRMAAPIGLNGGFGFGAEGAATPHAAEQRYLDFELKAVDMYVDMQISNKTVVLGSSNVSSMINALDAEIKGSYAAAKWNLGRALFGDGSGILAHFEPTEDGTNTLKVDDTSKLMEGLLLDIYAGEPGAYELQLNGVRVVHVDHKQNTVTLNYDDLYFEDPGMLTVQGSYNREITGLGAIFGDSDTIYGVSRVENPCLVPVTYSLGGKITDLGLYQGIRDAKKYRGAKINLIMMGDRAFEAYQTYMDEHTTHLVDKHKFVGGSTGYSILVGDQEVILVNESMIPENEAWGVDTESFILQQTPWEFLSNQGSIFSLMANSSVYRALLASYGNLICSNPGGCVKFTDCAA